MGLRHELSCASIESRYKTNSIL